MQKHASDPKAEFHWKDSQYLITDSGDPIDNLYYIWKQDVQMGPIVYMMTGNPNVFGYGGPFCGSRHLA